MAQITEIIRGNVGRIGDLRELNNGNAVLNLAVAVTPRKREGDNWVDDETVWTNISLWGDVARNVINSDIKPGTPVVVIGTRKARVVAAYTTKDGREVPEHVEQNVTADSIAVEITRWNVVTQTGKANNSGGAAGGAAQTQSTAKAKTSNTAANTNTFTGTDDPFGGDSSDIFGKGSSSDDSNIFGEDF